FGFRADASGIEKCPSQFACTLSIAYDYGQNPIYYQFNRTSRENFGRSDGTGGLGDVYLPAKLACYYYSCSHDSDCSFSHICGAVCIGNELKQFYLVCPDFGDWSVG